MSAFGPSFATTASVSLRPAAPRSAPFAVRPRDEAAAPPRRSERRFEDPTLRAPGTPHDCADVLLDLLDLGARFLRAVAPRRARPPLAGLRADGSARRPAVRGRPRAATGPFGRSRSAGRCRPFAGRKDGVKPVRSLVAHSLPAAHWEPHLLAFIQPCHVPGLPAAFQDALRAFKSSPPVGGALFFPLGALRAFVARLEPPPFALRTLASVT